MMMMMLFIITRTERFCEVFTNIIAYQRGEETHPNQFFSSSLQIVKYKLLTVGGGVPSYRWKLTNSSFNTSHWSWNKKENNAQEDSIMCWSILFPAGFAWVDDFIFQKFIQNNCPACPWLSIFLSTASGTLGSFALIIILYLLICSVHHHHRLHLNIYSSELIYRESPAPTPKCDRTYWGPITIGRLVQIDSGWLIQQQPDQVSFKCAKDKPSISSHQVWNSIFGAVFHAGGLCPNTITREESCVEYVGGRTVP